MSVQKKRFSVTFTPPYIHRLNRLVKEGVYMDPQAAIRHAMRRLFEYHRIPLTLEEITGHGV